jgi:PKD repeat protein
VNAIPVAVPGGNAGTAPNKFYEGVEGTTVQFQGSGMDLDNDELTYSWDFNNDGEPDATTAAATHTWVDDGTHSAVLTVNDGRGGIGQARVDVVISNVAPRVNAGEDIRITVGETMDLSGTFSDPGVNDSPWGWTWNIAQQAYLYAGNTNDQSAPVLGSHRFCRSGAYQAKLTVVDKDGDSGEDETTITVDALPVEIDVNPNQINLNGNGHGMITVRIFSSATVNAASLNPDQVKLTGEKGQGTSLARTGGGLWMWNAENDENGDGRVDAVAQFRRDELIRNGDLTLDSKELRLLGPIGECGDVLGKSTVSVKVNAKDKSTAAALQAKP